MLIFRGVYESWTERINTTKQLLSYFDVDKEMVIDNPTEAISILEECYADDAQRILDFLTRAIEVYEDTSKRYNKYKYLTELWYELEMRDIFDMYIEEI